MKFQPRISVSIIVLLTTAAVAYFLTSGKTEQKLCTMEAKVCPDESSVGRSGPNCEFAPCPTGKSSPTPSPVIDTTNTFEQDFTFTVPELEIKLTVDTKLKDLIYIVEGESAHFSTKSLMNLDKAKSTPPRLYPGRYYCTSEESAIGVITKYSTKPSFGAVKQVGNFYYEYSGPQATCSNSKTVNDLQSKQTELLMKAFETARPI